MNQFDKINKIFMYLYYNIIIFIIYYSKRITSLQGMKQIRGTDGWVNIWEYEDDNAENSSLGDAPWIIYDPFL